MSCGDEKRRFERYAVNLKAHFRLNDDTKQVDCSIRELSTEGLRIHSTSKIHFGSRLVLSVTVPETAQTFAIPVQIKWQKELYGERDFAYLAGGQVSPAGKPCLGELLEYMRTRTPGVSSACLDGTETQ